MGKLSHIQYKLPIIYVNWFAKWQIIIIISKYSSLARPKKKEKGIDFLCMFVYYLTSTFKFIMIVENHLSSIFDMLFVLIDEKWCQQLVHDIENF